MIVEIKENKARNGVELYFKVMPLEVTRTAMKQNGFRWSKNKGCWYAIATPQTMALAQSLASITDEAYQMLAAQTGERISKVYPKRQDNYINKPKVQKNKYGVKVGDIFGMSWGYDQTNNNYFQVIALAGEQSVRVVGVSPARQEVDAISPISANVVYDFRKCGRCRSIFIEDEVNGDLKRVQTRGNGKPYIRISNYIADLITTPVKKVYESWDR